MNPFSIQNHLGAPTFFKDGKPIFPLLFWQTEILDRDAQAFYASGIEIYSFFRSDWKHPFWIGENQYDFSRIDAAIREFHQKLPNAYCIPRIFVFAPYWWLEKNPEEVCGYAVDSPYTRDDDGRWQGSFHESFASEKWKKEMGEAFRQLIRHMTSADYSECVIGIHIGCGITGEWHLWSPQLYPDTSICMEKRYGRSIPPPGERDSDYYRCLHEATVDAIEHFAKIVKEESDYLTCVFYGYTPDMSNEVPWSIAGDHRAAALVHRLPEIDIIIAPHSYSRRRAGEDGYFRNFPASVALHGKLFIDEGDDRTYLDGRKGNGFIHVNGIVPSNIEESLQIIRREFGNMLTHNIGMWYMDLNGGWFHDDRIMAEIAKLKKWADYSMRLPRTRNSEIAVIASVDSEFYLPQRGKPGNEKYASRYIQQIGELCKTGAPFDFYVAEDLESDIMEQYRVIFCLDGLALSSDKRERLHKLQCNDRTFLWFHDSGAIVNGKRSSVNSGKLTGLDMNGPVPQSPLKCEFRDWISIDLGEPVIAAKTLREIFRAADIHIYTDSGDIVSASDSALMIHASSSGNKTIRLPKSCRITDLVSGEIQENTQVFSITMHFGETALFLLEPLK